MGIRGPGPTEGFRIRPVAIAARHFHALCEGLADMELRHPTSEEMWSDAFAALLAGLAVPAPQRRDEG